MGFVVLHIDKASGNDAGMTAHIERTIDPANADKERTQHNRYLIEYPEGVQDRTAAIQYRLDTAGVTRKIGTNQVRALRIILSGTPEDMQRIEAGGKLDQWCEDNLAWLRKTYGDDNVVSAVLHLDEKTPHIHATVVPIVTGERRKARKKKEDEKPEQEQDRPAKKQYSKKPADTVRLCSDDIMTRENLEYFQDSYGEAMNKYGLQRGIKGSDARHITTPQYYRDLYVKNEDLKEDIGYLQKQKQEVYDKVRDLYDRKDEVREKFLDMHDYARNKEKEIAEMESCLQQLKQEYEPYKAQEDMNLFFGVFPKLSEHLRIVQLCKGIGLTIESIRKLFNGEAVPITGKLHSIEYNRSFDVQDAKLQILKEQGKPNAPDKYRLSLNGQNIFDWFKQKYQELKQVIRPHIKPPDKSGSG